MKEGANNILSSVCSGGEAAKQHSQVDWPAEPETTSLKEKDLEHPEHCVSTMDSSSSLAVKGYGILQNNLVFT